MGSAIEREKDSSITLEREAKELALRVQALEQATAVLY